MIPLLRKYWPGRMCHLYHLYNEPLAQHLISANVGPTCCTLSTAVDGDLSDEWNIVI